MQGSKCQIIAFQIEIFLGFKEQSIIYLWVRVESVKIDYYQTKSYNENM